MLSLFAGFIPAIVTNFFGSAEKLFTAYINKEITKEQLHADLCKALLSAFQEVEKAHADSLSKTFGEFMQAAAQSRFMQHVWGAVALSQLAVLLWHQLGIPAIVAIGWIDSYPSSGTTVDWAYALVALCLGGGALALKSGPGGSSEQINKLISMIKK